MRPPAARGAQRAKDARLAPPTMSAYWRAAGMSYVGYANKCAQLVRDALKEPFKSAAKPREQVYFKSSRWEGGKPADTSASRVPGRVGGG